MKRMLVVMVKETGEEVTVSVRVNDGDFTKKDIGKLKYEVKRKILPNSEGVSYFRVRYNEKVGKLKGNSDSIKVLSVSDLSSSIDSMFMKLGVKNEK